MNVIVKGSKIEGKSVFAARDFKKGEVVVKWSTCSTQFTEADIKRLPKGRRKHASHLGKGKWVLFRSPGKYMNHSCYPNTKAVKGTDVSVRPINKGDEITVDYISEKVPVGRMKCNCGSKNCKGIIKTDYYI